MVPTPQMKNFAHRIHGLLVLLLLITGFEVLCADSVVVFNELQYHPREEGGVEWIEFHNQLAVNVDVSRWSLRGGVDFDFPDGAVIPARGFLLVASEPRALGQGALGPWTGQLSNNGESLRLRNNSGRLMDELAYGDRGVWPIGPDGSGSTLAKGEEGTGTADPRNWRTSAEQEGTPGRINFPDELAPPTELALIPLDATWRYNESGVELASDWASSDHQVGVGGWQSGQALLGAETTPAAMPEPIRTAFADPLGNDIVTYYFEIDFELNGVQVASADKLLIRHATDDGAIFYLNGVEVGSRFNMEAGAVTAATVSTGVVRNAELLGPFELSPAALVPGTNRLSVEVHQNNARSNDIVFGATLSVVQRRRATVPLVISELSGTNEERFFVEIANTSATPYFAGGIVLTSRGSVDGSYAIPAQVAIEGGGFLVLDETMLGFRPSNDDRLFLYAQDGSSLIDAARADDLPRAWSEEHGKMLVPEGATFGEPNTFSINSEVVINEIMYHFREDPGIGGSEAVFETDELIAIDAVWRYNESGVELPSGWQSSAHAVDGIDWKSGPSLIGFELGNAPEAILTPVASPNENAISSYYFESEFVVTAEQLAGPLSLQLWHVIDDGAVFYLNGVEVERYNLPDGPIEASTPSELTIRNAVLEGPFELPTRDLVEGRNRLSVEVHQSAPNSSDVLFGLVLNAVRELAPGSHPQPIVERDEEWIELFNKGSEEVDLTGWSIDGGIDFNFPVGTRIGAGDYLVVAKDVAALTSKYPELAQKMVGPYRNRLNNDRDLIRLEDAVENPVDEVRYVEGGRWPELADGNGSSLELRDPDADNNNPAAWAASDESVAQGWQQISYRMRGGQSFGLTNWNEFRLGMLRAGEVLIDDVSVRRDPDGAAEELVQNGTFQNGSDRWRIVGNHRHSRVFNEPGVPGNRVLHLVSSGAADTRHNHLESTLVNNTVLRADQLYEVSYRARWLAGSNQVHTSCYYQRLGRTTQIARVERCGTPGRENSQRVANLGPTFSELRHDPPVPAANEPVVVTARVEDPDGIGAVTLKARYEEGVVRSFVFAVDGEGRGRAVLPGAPAGDVIQFWLEGRDGLGAAGMAPARGPDSRALIQVEDGQGTGLPTQELRIIMLDSDRAFMLDTFNLMSNERLGGSAVSNRREVTYDVGIRLRGSGAGRARDGTVHRSFSIAFPADQLFRGVHSSVGIDRSGRSPVQRRQDEIYVKHMFNHAGVPCMYDDLVYLIGPSSTYTGTALMQMAAYGSVFTTSQFENGGKGSVYNVDITYDPVTSLGGIEGLKPPVPFTHLGTDFQDRGDSKEDYRTSFQIRTGRRRDDYATLIDFCQTLSLPTAELDARVDEVMDVDEWMRYTALTVLCGIGDTWVRGGLRHNIRVYAPESGHGGVVALPWDGDILFSAGTTSTLFPTNGNLRRVIDLPRVQRLYWGHIQDLVNGTFNADYMARWFAHYGSVMGANLSGQVGYVQARGDYALSQLPAEIPFRITTNDGNDFAVSGTQATVEGQGWINVREIRLAGRSDPLAISWLDGETWSVELPLLPGVNAIELEVYDFAGRLLETANLNITSRARGPQPVDSLRITELHYNPDGSDATEFLELKNIGSVPLPIEGVRFTDGISFVVPQNVTLAPGALALVVRNRAAFEARYGVGLAIVGEFAPDSLSNDGERIELQDASGNIIHEFAFSDVWYPATDGGGYSLVVRDENAAVADWNTAAGWGISGDRGGNPGQNNATFSQDFAGWQREYFSVEELAQPAFSGPLGDANGDGRANLLSYAAGLDPRELVPAEYLPAVSVVDGRLRLQVRVRKSAIDSASGAEFGSDLVSWREVAVPLEAPIDHGDGTVTLIYEDDGAMGSLHQFARHRVILSAP